MYIPAMGETESTHHRLGFGYSVRMNPNAVNQPILVRSQTELNEVPFVNYIANEFLP